MFVFFYPTLSLAAFYFLLERIERLGQMTADANGRFPTQSQGLGL